MRQQRRCVSRVKKQLHKTECNLCVLPTEEQRGRLGFPASFFFKFMSLCSCSMVIEKFLFLPEAFCDMTTDKEGWTLIGRFSNNDDKNWMKDTDEYWYDRTSSFSQTTDPADNTDMISPALWLVNGTEFKITRSDDPSHTALLHTTGGCLGGQTFRSKVTSYGDFRTCKVWATDACPGNCDVQYGGQFNVTEGFVGGGGKRRCDDDRQCGRERRCVQTCCAWHWNHRSWRSVVCSWSARRRSCRRRRVWVWQRRMGYQLVHAAHLRPQHVGADKSHNHWIEQVQ